MGKEQCNRYLNVLRDHRRRALRLRIGTAKEIGALCRKATRILGLHASHRNFFVDVMTGHSSRGCLYGETTAPGYQVAYCTRACWSHWQFCGNRGRVAPVTRSIALSVLRWYISPIPTRNTSWQEERLPVPPIRVRKPVRMHPLPPTLRVRQYRLRTG